MFFQFAIQGRNARENQMDVEESHMSPYDDYDDGSGVRMWR